MNHSLIAGVVLLGGGKRTDLTYTGSLTTFIPATESLSIFLGAHVGVGKTAGIEADGLVLHKNATSVLESFDLRPKWAGYLQLEFSIGAHGGHSF